MTNGNRAPGLSDRRRGQTHEYYADMMTGEDDGMVGARMA